MRARLVTITPRPVKQAGVQPVLLEAPAVCCQAWSNRARRVPSPLVPIHPCTSACSASAQTCSWAIHGLGHRPTQHGPPPKSAEMPTADRCRPC